MFEEVLNQLSRYVNGLASWRDLETSLVSHLQTILDSGDSRAMALANEIDASLLELSEDLITEEDFRQALEAVFVGAQTITVSTGEHIEAAIVDEAAALSETIAERWRDLGPVTDVRCQVSLA